jgi:hypothetical protein
MKNCVRLLVAAGGFAVASAYINRLHGPFHKCHVRESRLRQKMKSDDFFEEKRPKDVRQPMPWNQRQNVERFCVRVGCTIEDYERTTDQLKRRKIDLSNQMLALDDELKRHRHRGTDIDPGTPRKTRLVDEPPAKLDSSSWSWSSVRNALHNAHNMNMNLREGSHGSSVSILVERRQKLSDRAIAIQNLLAILQAMEATGPLAIDGTSGANGAADAPTIRTPPTPMEDLVERYRRIAWEEFIGIVARSENRKTATLIDRLKIPGGAFPFLDWNSLKLPSGAFSFPDCNSVELPSGSFSLLDWNLNWDPPKRPHPPHMPPTMQQFMVR